MTQWGRMNSGSEDGNYTSYENIEPKNAFFDTLQELRLVHGISDAHMLAFGDSLTIYGEGKINLLSANPRAMEMLIRLPRSRRRNGACKTAVARPCPTKAPTFWWGLPNAIKFLSTLGCGTTLTWFPDTFVLMHRRFQPWPHGLRYRPTPTWKSSGQARRPSTACRPSLS